MSGITFLRGVEKHDWNTILDRVPPATVMTLQFRCLLVFDKRSLIRRADQDLGEEGVEEAHIWGSMMAAILSTAESTRS